MKKILFYIFLSLSIFSYSNFLDKILEIDLLMEKKDYENAYILAKKLEKEELSNDDKLVVKNIIKDLEIKLPKKNEDIKPLIIKPTVENETVKTMPIKLDIKSFNEYDIYEKKVLESKSSNLINDLAKLYVSEGLLERALSLSLKDLDRHPKNIYLAATSARMLGKYDESIKLYNQVLNKNPQCYECYKSIAINYKLKQDYYRSIKYFKKYLQYVNSPEINEQINRLEGLE